MPSRVQPFSALNAMALHITSGFNHDEAMGLAEDLPVEDVYQLGGDAALHTLTVHNTYAVEQSTLNIHAKSKLSRADSTGAIDSPITLMAPVLIKKVVLNNSADLRISPHHRLLTITAMTTLARGAPK